MSPLNGSIDYKGALPPHKPPEKTKTQKKKRQKKTIINNPEEKPPRRHPWTPLLPLVRHPGNL